MIDELEEWLKKQHIQYALRRNDVVNIPDFGRCLYQSMDKRQHLFELDKDTDEVKFSCVENYEYLRNDDIRYVIVKFGDCFYYIDIENDKDLHILKYVGKPVENDFPCKFYPLGIHSGYELLNGSGALSLWTTKAKFLGYKGLAVCDKNTMGATLDLQQSAMAQGMAFCFGYSLTFRTAEDLIEAKIYSRTQEGFQNLLVIQKVINVDSEDKVIDIVDLCNLGKGNVIVFGKLSGQWLANQNNDEPLNDLLDAFDDAYFQFDITEYKADRIDSQVLLSTKAYFDAFYISPTEYDLDVKPVLIQDIYYADADDWKNKIVLNKIDTGAAHLQSDKQYMKTLEELFDEFDALFSEKYDEEVFYEMCNNTAKIIEGASAQYDLSANYMPQYEMTEEEEAKYGTNLNMFNQLIEEGFKKLVPEGQEERYRKQVEYEKYVICSTNNVDYFLIQYDCVNWARRNDILVGIGRGSAGGCLLLYLMGITKIDPIQYDLIFERFLLPERAGLYPAQVTIIGEDMDVKEYVEVELENNKTLRLAKDAQLIVNREGCAEPIVVLAEELNPSDDIIFDNRDLVFTLNEL